MRALLDVNVLIALFDADHTSHRAALSWFGMRAGNGWATCPITQNGCLRIMSHPGYPNARPVHDLVQRLNAATSTSLHQFWPDSVSLLDAQHIEPTRIHGPRQLTDMYLLALTVKHNGCLVTFDQSIALEAVRGATPSHIVVL